MRPWGRVWLKGHFWAGTKIFTLSRIWSIIIKARPCGLRHTFLKGTFFHIKVNLGYMAIWAKPKQLLAPTWNCSVCYTYALAWAALASFSWLLLITLEIVHIVPHMLQDLEGIFQSTYSREAAILYKSMKMNPFFLPISDFNFEQFAYTGKKLRKLLKLSQLISGSISHPTCPLAKRKKKKKKKREDLEKLLFLNLHTKRVFQAPHM